MELRNAVVLVTGGGSGIGASLCQHLAGLGAKLVVLDRSVDAATQVAKNIDGLAVACDVADGPVPRRHFNRSLKNSLKVYPLPSIARVLHPQNAWSVKKGRPY